IEQFDTPANILAAPANDYVSSFIGQGAALKRLALIPIADAKLKAASGAAGMPSVGADATLRDALDALVLAGLPAIDVVGGDGRAVGSITVDAISAVLGAELPGVPPAGA